MSRIGPLQDERSGLIIFLKRPAWPQSCRVFLFAHTSNHQYDWTEKLSNLENLENKKIKKKENIWIGIS